MDETIRNTFEFCLRGWVENSLLFKDPERWREGLKQELTEIPKLENKVKALSLGIDVSIQSLLLDAGFNTDEVFELMRMPPTAIDFIDADGGLEEWRKNRRKQRFQP